jgi:hypothetical protein
MAGIDSPSPSDVGARMTTRRSFAIGAFLAPFAARFAAAEGKPLVIMTSYAG